MYKIVKFANMAENNSFKLMEMHLSKPFKISEIKKMEMNVNSTFPIITNKIIPYYESKKQIGIFITEGIKQIELYCPNEKKYASFILSPSEIYKNNVLITDTPSLFVWNSGLFYRFSTGNEIANSIQLLSCVNEYHDIQNMYEVNVQSQYYRKISKQKRENVEYYDDDYEKKIILQGGL